MQRHIADFVEKQAAAVGAFKTTAMAADGAGKCPFFMTKQLRFQQLLGNGAAIYSHVWFIAPGAFVVNGPCYQLLASAGLAGYHHRRVTGGVKADFAIHFLHGGAGADQVVKARGNSYVAFGAVQKKLHPHRTIQLAGDNISAQIAPLSAGGQTQLHTAQGRAAFQRFIGQPGKDGKRAENLVFKRRFHTAYQPVASAAAQQFQLRCAHGQHCVVISHQFSGLRCNFRHVDFTS